jgi:photosystem II stability/assembly factor-like uncharacterized protein
MHRIDSATAEADKFGSGKDGWTEGEPGTTPPTETTDDWFDGVQEEICNVIENTGIALVKNTRDQLSDAVNVMLHRAALMSTWSRLTNQKLFTLRSVIHDAYSGNLFACGVADGTDAYMLRSLDGGMTWNEMANPQNLNLYAIAASDTGVLAAVGANAGTYPYCISSLNGGTSWTQRTLTATTLDLWDIIWANGLFVAVGRDGTPDGTVFTSPDGITWTKRTYTSSEGLYSVAYSQTLGLFCAVGDNYLSDIKAATSSDGITWTERSTGISIGELYSICWSEFLQLFVAVGQDIGSYPVIGTSPDGITWTQRTTGLIDISGDLNAVISVEDARVLVAVGQHLNNNTVESFLSVDGITWAHHNLVVNNGIGTLETARSLAIDSDHGAIFMSGGAVGGAPGATLARLPLPKAF